MNLSAAAKPRPRSEVIVRLTQPLTTWGVGLLARLGVNPLLVVLAHGLLGVAAAALIASGRNLVWAALLLQIKTLLDNMDGGLARATGQVTRMGRYLDTGLDFLVNVALFAALAQHGPPALAVLAFLLLTAVLSLDYNAERLYRLEHDPPAAASEEPPIGAPLPLYLLFKGLYDVLLAPQDRLIARLDAWRFHRLTHLPYTHAPQVLRHAWADLFSTASLVNLGLSSQMFLLGLCLVAGQPFWYVYAVLAQAFYAVCVQLLRGERLRGYLRGVKRP
jgi:archaetidylinositol phosphate synthase